MRRNSTAGGAWRGGVVVAVAAGLLATTPARAATETVLHSFSGHPGDGANPMSGLINVKGTLYGTTQSGGNPGPGAVFAITSGGTETMLHSFGNGTDGLDVLAGLIDVNGTMYGTTSYGGAYGQGSVFSITPAGTEAVIYSFTGGSDGGNPSASLTNVKGKLYGTTQNGGASLAGTVFSVTPAGVEKVIYSFQRNGADGEGPYANLIDVKGTLYGTTAEGGANGVGTVFSVTTKGTETVLHSFQGNTEDGGDPVAGLIDVKGKMYGTTLNGGTYNGGTVFSITPKGAETVLHSFPNNGVDGEYPYASLINIKGTLYSTTWYGGNGSCSDGAQLGCGTVFSITPAGAEAVLYSFQLDSHDGGWPTAGLIDVKGTLYGTTGYGGSDNMGTVFSIKP